MSKTIDLVYTGRHGIVLVPLPGGGEVTAQWGTPITTTEEHAEALLQQPDNWQRATRKRAAKESE